jgi:lysophospholipase L1-like esterase
MTMSSRAGVAAAAVLLAAGCDGPAKPTPTPDAPAIACPANLTMRGVPGGMQPVSYAAPTVTGGAPPVTVTCTPGSGTSFSVGTTAVVCNAVDTLSRQAPCSFTVTLTPLLLSVTKFVAFGDSFTEGEDGRTARLGFGFIDRTGTYPFLLEARLNNEYPGQSIVVENRGKSGEPIDDGRQRLPGELATYHPGALLLLDGYNDLLGSCGDRDPAAASSVECANAITNVVAGYRKMIQIAGSAGVKYVFASTLTPPGPYRAGTYRRIANSAIVQTNTKLSPIVSAEGAILVDPYPVFIGHEADYVADDGLHLRRAGYQALADTFFATIKSTVASTPAFGIGQR